MKRLAILIAVIPPLAAFPGGAGSRSNTTFQDPCPDDPGHHAPDVCSVQVSNDDSGKVSFVLQVLNELDLGLVPNSRVVIYLDTDGNAGTGCGPNRADVQLSASGGSSRGSFGELVCRNGALVAPTVGSVDGCLNCPGEGYLSLTMGRCDLGPRTGFDFWIETSWAAEGLSGHDRAPDAATWHYDLAGPAAACAKALTLTAGRLVVTPRRPNAGSRLQATLHVSTSDVAAALGGRLTCSARVGRTKLRAVAALRSAGTAVRASCAWTVPKSARGRMLTGSVKLTARGVVAGRTFAVRVA